jgi:autotransporter translocation and assembly factor TamB
MRLDDEAALAHVRALLHYEPTTGALTWKQDRRMGKAQNGAIVARAGGRAGGLEVATGYWQINISGVGKMRLHTLIWWMVTGKRPAVLIDHKNGIRDDNRWDNLREASTTVNAENRHAARCDSQTGVMGVQFHAKKQRFAARITKSGKKLVLGYFKTPQEASAVYQQAKRELHAVAPA